MLEEEQNNMVLNSCDITCQQALKKESKGNANQMKLEKFVD